MHFGLTEEQEMIVSTVRSFVENEIYPHEEMVEKTGQVPHELGEELKQKCIDLGFYACNFPGKRRRRGPRPPRFHAGERELGRGSMALNHFFGRPQNILMACEGEQKEKYLLPAVRGEKMDALAMTEPDAGSDVRGMKCQAVRDGGDWVINGSKHFISGAEHADFFIVFVATGVDDTPKGPKKRITCFLVDRGTPGFEVRDGYNSVSHKGYKNYILYFDQCRLPDATGAG
jgi:acyl-CoA dehydrogenase